MSHDRLGVEPAHCLYLGFLCYCISHCVGEVLQNPGKKGLIAMMMGDGIVGWPAKRDISGESGCKQENKDACWNASEAAVGAFF